MGVLAQIFSSKVRAEIFRLLFGLEDVELHIREIARRSATHEASVRQELMKLEKLDLVNHRRSSNRVYYRANVKHPLYIEIHNIVQKTEGLVDVLDEALEKANAHVAFVFGSVASGSHSSESDIDLMVIGDLGFRELTTLLHGVSEKLGREVNSHVMTESEYRERMGRKDHFVTNVLSGPKLYIVGDQDDLEAMAR